MEEVAPSLLVRAAVQRGLGLSLHFDCWLSPRSLGRFGGTWLFFHGSSRFIVVSKHPYLFETVFAKVKVILFAQPDLSLVVV